MKKRTSAQLRARARARGKTASPMHLRFPWERAQQLELGYWRENLQKPCNREGALAASKMLCRQFQLDELASGANRILDIGAGPTGRLCSLANGKREIVAIDPLGTEYQRLPGALCDVYSSWITKPAEADMPELYDWSDMTCCINCLDHCNDPAAVVGNMLKYTRHDGYGFLSTDVSEQSEAMHCRRMKPEIIDAMIEQAGWIIERRMAGRAWPMPGQGWSGGYQPGWSPGVIAHHWWLRRP